MEELCKHQIEIKQLCPKEGWFEQDPIEILNAVLECATEACKKLEELGYSKQNIACIGITNQRETTVVWDKLTGQPLHNAIGI